LLFSTLINYDQTYSMLLLVSHHGIITHCASMRHASTLVVGMKDHGSWFCQASLPRCASTQSGQV